MPMIEMSENTDLDTIRNLSVATFTETFGPDNTAEDMNEYITTRFAPDVLQAEIDDPQSAFLVATVDGEPAGYMKVNVGEAQTEEMLGNRMEIQRLYILERFKRRGLGTRFVRSAFDMARAQGKSMVWLGVWEHNEAAREFYRHMGFVKFGEHDFMLGDDAQTDILLEAAVPRLG